MNDHLLITGGAGFIGSHLAERWLAEGGSVTALDDLSTGRVNNLSACMRSSRFRVVHASILDRRSVRRLVEETDTIAHLAAVVGVARVCRDPLSTWRVNLEGSQVVLDAAAELGRPVLLASSSEVYGDAAPMPACEDGPVGFGTPEHPRWSYASSKAAMESLGLALHAETELPVRVVRFFNTSGPRQSATSGMVLPTLIESALAGRDLRVFGDGTQTRAFCHVLDTVEALVRLLREERAVGKVVNVGNDNEVTILSLAKRVIERTGARGTITHVPHPQAIDAVVADPQRRVPELTRLADLVGYRPERPVDAIIDDIAATLVAQERPAGP